jgi:uncharacterized protein
MNIQHHLPMEKRRKEHSLVFFCLILLLMIFTFAGAKAQETVAIGTFRKLSSEVLGGEVRYIEHLPEGYDKNKNTYPVLYMMNAQSVANFANAAAAVDYLSSERIPDMILIGICNEGAAANYWACPDDSGRMTFAEKFNRFLGEELIPDVDKNYRTNGYRIFDGQSNTGLFVLNSFITHADLFNAYVVVSPMLGWCADYQLKELSHFLRLNQNINKRLNISYGELDYKEVLDPADSLSKVLKQYAPAGLHWKISKISNDGHVPFSGLHEGLLDIFSPCTLTPALQKSSIAEIKSHYSTLSAEYGFEINPKGDILMNLAWDLKDQKKYDSAIEFFNYLTALYPSNAMYWATFGITLYKQGDLQAAREKAVTALSLDPEQPQAKALMAKLDK